MGGDSAEAVLAPRDGRATRGRSWRRVVLAVLIVALVGGLAWGAWWWRHPGAFHQAPADEWSLGGGEIEPTSDLPLHIRTAWPKQDSVGAVTLTKAEPHMLVNTADAQISFHICVAGREGISSVHGDLSDWCQNVTELEGAEFPLSTTSPVDPIIMTISATNPGELKLQGMDLTYQQGFQNGMQRVGEYVWLRFE